MAGDNESRQTAAVLDGTHIQRKREGKRGA
jgi:hypothetical protein